MEGLNIESMTIHIAVCGQSADEREQCIKAIWLASAKRGISIKLYRYDTSGALYHDIMQKAVFIHILYLDMENAGRNGIETARLLRTAGYGGKIILQAASAERLQEAFDVSAFHFILKGECGKNKFEEILFRAIDCVTQENGIQIRLVFGINVLCMPLMDVRYFCTSGRHAEAHYKDGIFLFNSSIRKVAADLSEFEFIQINRTTVVNIAAVQKISRGGIVLKDGTVLIVGEAYGGCFRQSYGRWADGQKNIIVTMSDQRAII